MLISEAELNIIRSTLDDAEDIIKLATDPPAQIQINAPLALMQCSAGGKVLVIRELMQKGII